MAVTDHSFFNNFSDHLHMNCCDVGIPSPHTAGQVAKHKEVKILYILLHMTNLEKSTLILFKKWM